MHRILEVDNLTLAYSTGDQLLTALYQVSFHVEAGDRLVLLGSSGCGKSSLLNAVAGFIPPTKGKILLDGRPVQRPGPDRVMVFQGFDQLLPWKTVRENIAFGLIASGKCKGRAAIDKANAALARVKLEAFAESYPHTLSGGMKQRIALARALAMEPRILLMDEPFAALDALTRVQMQEELLRLWEDTRFTMMFVTHSIHEALAVGSRILLLSPHPGRLRAELAGGSRSPERVSIIHELLFGAPAPSGTDHD